MTLASSALTTVATVLDELDLEGADRKVRARIERYITSASSLVAVILGNGRTRQLHEAAVTVAVAGMGHPILILPHTPIVSVAEVLIDDEAVDADEYEIHNAEAGFLFRVDGTWPASMLIRGGTVGARAPGTERKNIEVTYTAGWKTPAQAGTQTLPTAIEDAVVELVVSRWRRRGKDLRVVGETLAGGSSYTYGGAAVPPEVMAALGPYVRIANG